MDPGSSQPPVVLTIAGFDPSSGAGATADLQVFAAHGLFGTACPTALTVQSTMGVARVQVTDPTLLREMLTHLTRDMPPAGVKIGMLGDVAVTRVVAEFLQVLHEDRVIPIVVDPVLQSSSGAMLLDEEAVATLVADLLPHATCMTPNHKELARLLGRGDFLPEDLGEAAAILLQRTGAESVVVTGGDDDPPADLFLQQQRNPIWLTGQRVDTRATHGTGCAFSSALLSRIVLGDCLLDAAKQAKLYVENSLRSAPQLGSGKGPMKLSLGPYAKAGGSTEVKGGKKRL